MGDIFGRTTFLQLNSSRPQAFAECVDEFLQNKSPSENCCLKSETLTELKKKLDADLLKDMQKRVGIKDESLMNFELLIQAVREVVILKRGGVKCFVEDKRHKYRIILSCLLKSLIY